MLITVFTSTFNRAYILPRLYESLVNQTSKSFEWVIVDDASTDGTCELVKEFIKAGCIKIKYVQKKIGG